MRVQIFPMEARPFGRTRERWPRTRRPGRFEVPGRPVLMLPGPIFPPVSKRAGKRAPGRFFRLPGGVGHGGVVFSYEPRTPDSQGGWPWGGHFQLQTAYSRFRRRKSLSKSNFTRGPGSNVCTDFPGLHFRGGAPPLVVKQIRYELATMYVMLIPGPFWPPDWYQEAHFGHIGHMRER